MTRPLAISMAIVVLTSCFVLAQEHDKPYSADQVHSQTWAASTKALITVVPPPEGRLAAPSVSSASPVPSSTTAESVIPAALLAGCNPPCSIHYIGHARVM